MTSAKFNIVAVYLYFIFRGTQPYYLAVVSRCSGKIHNLLCSCRGQSSSMRYASDQPFSLITILPLSPGILARDTIYFVAVVRASIKRTYGVYYALRLPPDVQIELQRRTADFRNFFCLSDIDTRDVQKLSKGPPTFNQLYDVCPAYLPEIRYLC